MRPQKRKTPGRKETKHKAAQVKETVPQNQPLDPVLMGEYHRETTQAWRSSQAAYSLRLETPQAWEAWKTAVSHHYDIYKKYAYLFAPTEPLSEDAARYRWDFRRGWDFRRDVELLRGGDHTKMEMAIAFLEADPWFQGSGYDKVRLIRYIKPAMLKPGHIKRLQGVVVSLVDRRDDRDFRAFCKLARKVDGPALREQLTQRLTSGDPDIRRRARWVLEALAQKNRMEKRT